LRSSSKKARRFFGLGGGMADVAVVVGEEGGEIVSFESEDDRGLFLAEGDAQSGFGGPGGWEQVLGLEFRAGGE
jgi:hypothetical protein